MANVFRENVWIIDTASATNITADLVLIDVIRWVGSADADVIAEIADGAGLVVWEDRVDATAAATAFGRESRAPLKLTGLRVPTLGAGKLYLYHDINRG